MVNDVKKAVELELLAPARDLATGIAAVLAGADAVYIGGPLFGARAAAGNPWEDIAALVEFAHQYYVKVYVPINTIIYDEELAAAKDAVFKAYEIGVDAVIIQDMAIMEMDLPPIPVFASTQTNNYDVEQIKFLQAAGFSRVILARECDLERIKEIRRQTSVDLEVFVHGALCVSFSGRCYMSEAMCKRSANRGQCIQACRLPYSLVDGDGKILIKNKFLLSLKDLNLFNSLAELVGSGVTSFKIEGRLKDGIYVANVVAKYREGLDKIIKAGNGKYKRQSSGSTLLDFEPDLEKTFNRGFTDYFLRGRRQDIVSLDSQKSLGKFVAKVATVGGDFFTLDRGHDLANGDGLCWFDENNNLTGVNINSVIEERIYPAKWVSLEPGTKIYRNLDTAFEKKAAHGVQRRVAVDFTFKETNEGFSVSAKDEDGNFVETVCRFEKKLAQKPELVEGSWRQQFSKTGGTIFAARDFSFNLSRPYFVPLSVLNGWRRDLTEKLLKERIKNYPRVLVEHKKTEDSFYQKEIDCYFNVANKLARNFCERHGVKVMEPCFEKITGKKERKLMTAKHCLRYFLGGCKKDAAGTKINEPLLLLYQGKKFRLNFNCADCVMEIWDR